MQSWKSKAVLVRRHKKAVYIISHTCIQIKEKGDSVFILFVCFTFVLLENDDFSKGRNMVEEMLKSNMSDADILYEINTMIFAVSK